MFINEARALFETTSLKGKASPAAAGARDPALPREVLSRHPLPWPRTERLSCGAGENGFVKSRTGTGASHSSSEAPVTREEGFAWCGHPHTLS